MGRYQQDKIYMLKPTTTGPVIQETNHRSGNNGTDLCSMEATRQNTTCPRGYFMCKDLTCIVETSKCDGHNDSLEGDDETECSGICTASNPTAFCTQCTVVEGCQCTSLYFQCSSGGCISAAAVCDGFAACTDGSDEAHCTVTP